MSQSWRTLLFGGLAAGVVSPAAAQCLSIPDGTGGVAVHCSDGQVGQLRVDQAGGVAGMVGAQAVTGSIDRLASPGLASGAQPPGYRNTDIALRPQPLVAPPLAPPAVVEERPFSAYPDPAAAGLRLSPGEN